MVPNVLMSKEKSITMNKFKLAILPILFILSVAVVGAQDNNTKPVITLERTACFGRCPIYTISIFENGDVVYKGENSVTVTGEQKSQIDPETVKAMVEAFEKAGYFDWKEAYDTQMVTDLPSAITSVTRNGETHQIRHYLGDHTVPVALTYLEHWIDLMTTSNLRTGAEFNFSSISNGSDSPLITLERGACFGFCPVYNLAVYKDGTVVKMGIANVPDLGVTVTKVDGFAVEGVVQQAQALGYFDWKDRYDTQVKTDQTTVVSSVQWEDQYKQIYRYNGDPNAPVGLVWIEDSIDALVSNPAS